MICGFIYFEMIQKSLFVSDYLLFLCPLVTNNFSAIIWHPMWQAMLFLNFSTGPFESFKSAYYGAASDFKENEVKFLIGDIEASQGAFQVCLVLQPIFQCSKFIEPLY
jgi:hypothetical protein